LRRDNPFQTKSPCANLQKKSCTAHLRCDDRNAGRKLHQGLGVGRDYVTWIKSRIAKYGFREGVDYEVQPIDFIDPQNGVTTKSSAYEGVKVAHIYSLTLDMAKELAMVENNETGRTLRRYFIWAENRLHQGAGETIAIGRALAEFRSDFNAELAEARRATAVLSERRGH
jgi:phage anti-repressor protein